MKKISIKAMLIASVVCGSFTMTAQTLEEGIQLYKYDRFESAKKILAPLGATDPIANYYEGLSEIGLENYEKAKTIFQKYPENPANLAGMARVLFHENKSADAMSLVSKIAAKAKKKDYLPMKYAADAITYSDGGDPNVAVELYKKAMAIERTGDLHIGIGDVYRKIQGGGGSAMNNYEYAEEFPTTKSLANFKMGSLWYAAKSYDSALSKYAKATQYDEKNPLPYRDLAAAYYKIKKYAISKENIEKYLTLSDNTIDDQIQYANTLYQAQDYPAAIAKMEDLIKKGAEKPYMYRVIGYSLFEQKDYKGALSNMDKLFAKQDPKKIIPLDYIYYGKLMMKDSTKATSAQTYFDKGVALDTSEDKTYLYRELAESFKGSEDYKASGQWFQKITETNAPTIQPLDYWWSGVMYFYGKDYSNAEKMLTLMGQKYPDEKSTFHYLARNTENWKDPNTNNGAAVTAYKNWLALVNDDPNVKNDLVRAYNYLALYAYNSKNKTDAATYANKVLALDASNSTSNSILKNLGSIK